MRISMDVVGDPYTLLNSCAVLLLNSFAYANTGSIDNHRIRVLPYSDYPSQWESEYGRVSILGSVHTGEFNIVMDVDHTHGTRFVARALGVFEYFMHEYNAEAERIKIIDNARRVDVELQDLNSTNLYKLIPSVGNSEEWWDNNVLPVLEKIWEE